MSNCDSSRLFRTMLIGVLVSACSGAEDGSSSGAESGTGLRIDDSCSSASECGAESAECVDGGDGVSRCEAQCLGDKDCGDGANCLFKGSSDVGSCYRTCNSVEDCAGPNWRCEQYASDTTQSFCLPPCALSACTAGSFHYTCSAGSYMSHIVTSGGTTNASYSFSNGHSVNCTVQSGKGSCQDDTGSTCSF
jgi:hypothetical protein